MKNLIACSVLFAGLSAFAAEYYVDSEKGCDNAAGTSEAAAWKSLDKVNAAPLQPGDTVRFKRGGLWRGQLVPVSGEPGKPVTYTWYGKGPKPILQNSVDRSRPEDWVEEKPGFWSTRKCEPVVGAQVWRPSAGDTWDPSFQEGMQGTVKKVVEGDDTFCRVTFTKVGPKRAPHLIQLWGPKMVNLPDTCLLKMKVRSSKPFRLSNVRLMQGNAPYTASHAGPVKVGRDVGTAWQEATAVISTVSRNLTGTPRFHLSIGDNLPEGAVFDVKVEGIWAATVDSSLFIEKDIGIFICNHGEKWGVKKWNNPDWDVSKTEKWQRSVKMENDLDYWYDPFEGRVVVKYPQNPGVAFKSIELAKTSHVINQGGKHDVVYDGLWVRYGAAHGFGGGSTVNLVIRNCDISWIGGGLQFWRKSEKTGKIVYPVRFGNGIEFWGDCRNHLIERCRLWEIYDAALTNQGRNDSETEITWRDNVIWNSEYSYEYWNCKLTRNILFEHNTCVDAGFGWAHEQRPDQNGSHLMYYSNRAATTNFVVRNNIFYRATEWTMRSALDWRSGLAHDHNLVWNDGNVPIGRWLEGKKLSLVDWAGWQALGFDVNGQFAQPRFVNAAVRDYRLQAGSPGKGAATDGTDLGARNMPGLDGDQSITGCSK